MQNIYNYIIFLRNVKITTEILALRVPCLCDKMFVTYPERISLLLQIEESSDNSGDNGESGDNEKKVAIKNGDNNKKVAIKSGDNDKKPMLKTELQKVAIVEYLTEKVTVKALEVEELLGVKKSRARKLLSELIEADIILAEGANRNRIYRLK